MLKFSQFLAESKCWSEPQVKALKGKVDNPYAVSCASQKKKKAKVNEEYIPLRERRMQRFNNLKVIN